MVPPLRDHPWWHWLLSASSLSSTPSPSSSPPRLLQAAMNWVLPAQAALCANTFAIHLQLATSFGEDKDDGTLWCLLTWLITWLNFSQVHQIKVCSPLATQPSISIIFITATLGQHLHRHYPRLNLLTPSNSSITERGCAVSGLPSLPPFLFLFSATNPTAACFLQYSLLDISTLDSELAELLSKVHMDRRWCLIAFTGWWEGGQKCKLETTFFTSLPAGGHNLLFSDSLAPLLEIHSQTFRSHKGSNLFSTCPLAEFQCWWQSQVRAWRPNLARTRPFSAPHAFLQGLKFSAQPKISVCSH